MTRRGWATAILVVWVAALGWLVRREFFQSTGARLAEAALSVPPGAAYYRLDVGGQHPFPLRQRFYPLRGGQLLPSGLGVHIP